MAQKKVLFIPIGVKLIGIVSAILVIALLGMTLIATGFFTEQIEGSVRDSASENARLIADRTETELTALKDRARLVAAALDGGITLAQTGESLTMSVLEQDEGLVGVCILASAGQDDEEPALLASAISQGWLDRAGLRKEQVEAAALARRGAFGAAFAGDDSIVNISPEIDYSLLALASPFKKVSAREAESVVVAFVSPDNILKALKGKELYLNFITGEGGAILAHPDQNLLLIDADLRNNPIVADSLVSAMGTVKNKEMRFEQDGKTYLGSYQRFYDGSLTAFSVVEAAKALEPVYETQQRNILITVLFVIASIILILLYSKTLTSPIKRLVAGTKQIQEAKYDVQIPVKNHDELGRLTESFLGMARGLADRDKLADAFGKFVNPELTEKVLKGQIELGGEERVAAIFFSDIRSFTAISEKLKPNEVVEFLNDYMTRMVECVEKTNGIVDKFIGDAVMATWGVPESKGNDTENAINGALMMREALREFNVGRGGDKKPIIKIGCGINTGPVIAGQIGAPKKLSYTVIGDAVNLASRIESLNKPFRTDILISEESLSLVKGIFKVEPMKKIMVKGKSEPQQIYAVIGRMDDPKCPASLDDVRRSLGIETGALGEDVNPDAHEEKYEILE